MHMTITRMAMDREATLSEIKVGDASFYGIEKPWRDNRASVSCIPTGFYALVPFNSRKFGKTWAFVGGTVSSNKSRSTKRFACLIHKGNVGGDVQGCLAVGMSLPMPSKSGAGQLRVANSRGAFDRLIKMLEGGPFHTVEINWA